MEKKIIYIIGSVSAVILIAALMIFLQVDKMKAQVNVIGDEINEAKIKIAQIEPIIAKITKILPVEQPGQPTGEVIEVTGRVGYSDVEGGCWYIDVNAGCDSPDTCPLGEAAPYVPVNLPDALKEAGTQAVFKLKMRPDLVSICMLGPLVEIVSWSIVK